MDTKKEEPCDLVMSHVPDEKKKMSTIFCFCESDSQKYGANGDKF